MCCNCFIVLNVSKFCTRILDSPFGFIGQFQAKMEGNVINLVSSDEEVCFQTNKKRIYQLNTIEMHQFQIELV